MGIYRRVLQSFGLRRNKKKFRRSVNPCPDVIPPTLDDVESQQATDLVSNEDECSFTNPVTCVHTTTAASQLENNVKSVSSLKSALKDSYNKGKEQIVSATKSVHFSPDTVFRYRTKQRRKSSGKRSCQQCRRVSIGEVKSSHSMKNMSATGASVRTDDTLAKVDELRTVSSSTSGKGAVPITETKYNRKPVFRMISKEFLTHLERLNGDKVIMAAAVKYRIEQKESGGFDRFQNTALNEEMTYSNTSATKCVYNKGDIGDIQRAFDFYFPGHIEQLKSLAKDKTYTIRMI